MHNNNYRFRNVKRGYGSGFFHTKNLVVHVQFLESWGKNPHNVFKGKKNLMMKVGAAFFPLMSGSVAKTNISSAFDSES